MKIINAILLFLVFPFLMAFAQSSSELTVRADSLFSIHQEEQALELYQSVLEDNPEHYKALWRSSLLLSRIGNRLDDENDQEDYFNRAITHAERSLAVDSLNTQANYVMAVAMGRQALIAGAKDRVAASRAIKKYADRAVSADSSNAGAWHVLGRWHFKVANLSWIERTAANTLFGGIPGEASNESAVTSIEKAIALKDDYLLYYYDLAQVYQEMGQDEQALTTCIGAIQQPLLRPGDEEIKQNCQQLIQDLK